MSKLAEVLYPAPPMVHSAGSLLRWWESRRWLYNKLVGLAGLVTVAATSALGALTFVGPPPWAMIVAVSIGWGVMANVFYSLGFVVELVARAAWKDRAPRMGPLLFREGLIFSVGLTLFPIALMALNVGARVVYRLLTLVF